MAEATGFEYVSLSEGSVDPAVDLVDEKMLRKHGALPLRVEDGRLVLATSDPTNVLALDDLKTLAGYPIRPVVAPGENIRNLQDRASELREELHEFLEADEAPPSLEQTTPGASPAPPTRGLRRCSSPTPSSAGPCPRGPRISTSSLARRNSSCVTGWTAS